MKKILEVLQSGTGELIFNTDIDINKNPDAIPQIASMGAFSMSTSLWGGNEASVLAVLRAHTIADLSLCVHRKEIIKELEECARSLENCMNQARREFEKAGGKIATFPPDVKPPKSFS